MKDNFSQQSKTYARFRPGYPVVLIDHILGLVKEKNKAWDCGTGNGQVATVLADSFKEVYATDISESQLKNAAKKPNIIYSVQSAEHSSFPDNNFDLITVAQAIHWFDFDKFYAEVNRTLKPGGIIAIIGYSLFNSDAETDKVLQHFYTNIVGEYWDKERHYVDEQYKTIPFPFEEISTPAFGMQYHWTLEDVLGYLSSWSAVQHFIRINHKDPVLAIRPELEKAWGKEHHKMVRFPLFMRIGRKS